VAFVKKAVPGLGEILPRESSILKEVKRGIK
jgi:hypothetical protein